MNKRNVSKDTYDFRVVRDKDVLVDLASGGDCTVYSVCEVHYDSDGKPTEISVLNDMTCYSRADATDFLMRISAATLKPVIDKQGREIENCLINPAHAVMSYLGSTR